MTVKKEFKLLEGVFNEMRRRRERGMLTGDEAMCLEYIDYLEKYIEEKNVRIEEVFKFASDQVERANFLDSQLIKIAEETNCDDTHEYINRLLKGEGKGLLPYRINEEESK